MNLNRVFLAGRLCADPELKNLPSGTSVAEFRLATNRRWKDGQTNEWREEACFIDVKCYGKRAPVIQQYFHRGNPILLEGHLRHETWEKEGKNHSKHVVVLDNFEFVLPKADAALPDEDAEATTDAPLAASHDPAASPVARKRRERALAGAAADVSDAEAARLPF